MSAAILEPTAPPVDTRPPEARDRDEIWNGVRRMAAMANRWHQNLARDLVNYLLAYWAEDIGGDVNQEVNLTTPEDEDNWTSNYRIPDLVLLDPARFPIDKNEYMVGAPLVVVEIRSPGDDSYAKLPFYADLGVPEVWIIHRDTKVPEIRILNEDGEYELLLPDAAGWHVSPHTGVQFQPVGGKLRARVGTDDATAADLPKR